MNTGSIAPQINVVGEKGDLSAPAGSRAWAIAVRGELQSALHRVTHSGHHLQRMLKVFEEYHGYEALENETGKPFKSYEEFCTARTPFGLGMHTADIDRIIAERKSAEKLARENEDKPLKTVGEIGRGRNRDCVTISKHKSDAEYLTRRIARDRPDILQRMKAGEFKSVRAAGLEAGIVKPRLSIPNDLEGAARALKRHFSANELAILSGLITGEET